MKIAKIIAAAGLAVAAVAGASSADAQTYRHHRGGYEHRYDRHVNRGHAGWNRGHGWGHRRICRTEWRHHHRVTICR
ncbi:MAG: hypothetical protein WDN44_04160 [Sphingomonas sp.]